MEEEKVAIQTSGEKECDLETDSPKSRKIAAGRKNMIPLSQRTSVEQKRIAQLGGKASGAKRRQKKTLQEALKWFLDMEMNPQTPDEEELIRMYPGLTNWDYIAISAVRAAIQDRDVRAMVFIRDTIGEMPKHNVSVEQERPFEIVIKTVSQT